MIGWVNLVRQHASLRDELTAAITEVIADSDFILGARVSDFERRFAAYCGVAHGIGVNSGTSALHLALLAAGAGPGDEVITTAFTFQATVAAIGYTGARPVLVDIDPATFCLDVRLIEAAITEKTKAIVPVHLYGHPADMHPLVKIARRHNIAIIEDAAQAHGATHDNRRVGSLGDAGCFSFYPSKNLGACGEGGMVVTDKADWASRIRSLRNWGLGDHDQAAERAFNYRMTGTQGAVLGVKLRFLEEWNEARRRNAAHYDAVLQGSCLHAAKVMPWARHVYHIYAIRTAGRASVQQRLLAAGIETRIHYPSPVHLLAAWRYLGYRPGDFPEAERAANETLSIPVSPELHTTEVEHIGKSLTNLRETIG